MINTQNEQHWSTFVRDVLKDKQAKKIQGMLCDTFTASAMVQLMDKLSQDNLNKFKSMPFQKAVDVTWKLVLKQK